MPSASPQFGTPSWLCFVGALLCCAGEISQPSDTRVPVSLTVQAGDGQLFFPAVRLHERLTVRLADSAGNPVTRSGVPISWEIVEGGGTVLAVDDTTNESGTSSAEWTLGPDIGVNRLTVSSVGISSVEFHSRSTLPGPIAFVSNRRLGVIGDVVGGFPGDLYVMNPDGTDVVGLYPSNYITQMLFDPVWSPDAERVLFVRATGRPAGGTPGLTRIGLFSIRPNGTDEIQVPAAGLPGYVRFFQDPAWHPVGDRIAAALVPDTSVILPPEVTAGALHVMSQTGLNAEPMDQLGIPAFSPSWDVTTRRIAFSCTVGSSTGICVANEDGSNSRSLTDGSQSDVDPAWSPLGDRVLFARDSVTGGGIWVVDEDGGNLIKLVNGKATSPSWSPDGTRFVYERNDDGRIDIWIYSFFDGMSVNLTNAASRDSDPVWRWAPVSTNGRPAHSP